MAAKQRSGSRLKLTIPTRIFLSFVLVLFAFGGVSAATLIQHQQTAETLRLLDEGYLPLALMLGDVKATQSVFTTYVDRLAQGDELVRFWVDRARRVRLGRLELGFESLEAAQRANPPPADRQALTEIQGAMEEVQSAYERADEDIDALFVARSQGRQAEAERLLEGIQRHESRIAETLGDAHSLVQARIAATSETAAERERTALLTIALMTLVSLLLGVGVLWWSQRLLSPLPRLQARVSAVAAGDLVGRILPERDDEIGRLTSEFEKMVDAVGARDRKLRELQRMQEQIVAGLRSGVIVLDGHGEIRSVNAAASRVLGTTIDDVGENHRNLPFGQHIDGFEEALSIVAETGRSQIMEATPMRLPEGGVRHLDVRLTPFGMDLTSEGHHSVLAVADDVTEELRTKARLIQTERLAAIGRMAAHVTHEVRNPLSSIGLNVELLEEEFEANSEGSTLLRAIQREINRLTGVTEEYLRLARLPEPRLEPERVDNIAAEVARFVQREMSNSEVRIETRIAEALPLVAADESQIRQALLNLLRNAREAMTEGGVIELDVRPESGGIEIEVRDHGLGIPEGQRSHIFDLFYSTKERGTGLGLPLTQQIIAAHGGRIECRDAEGGGTTFVLWLPAAAKSG